MSYLVANPEGRFSHNEAHGISYTKTKQKLLADQELEGKLSNIMKKPVFGVFDQGRLKLAYSAIENS